MIVESIRIAIQSIRMSRLRSFLTMTVITIGVFLFVIVSMFVDGLRGSIGQQADDLGENLIAITPGQTVVKDVDGNITEINPFSSSGLSTLTENDLVDLESLEGVDAIAPQMIVSGLVTADGRQANGATTLATNGDLPEALDLKLRDGAFFGNRSGLRTAVIGDGIQQQFSETVGVGSTITFRDEDFVVAGVLEETNRISVNIGLDFDQVVFIPLEQGLDFNEGSILLNEINIKVDEDIDSDEFVADAEQLLLENHGGQRDFTVLRQQEIQEASDDILGVVKAVSQGVSLIVSAIALIVVMLIMYVSVSERTKEIGIRKAIGAQRSDIVLQFLIESLTLSFYGAATGLLLAFFVGNLVEAFLGIPMRLTTETILQSSLLFIAVGLLGGFVPAFIAARKDPVSSIRG